MAIDRNERFDVIVVGAGPAGAAAALRLAEQRVKVLVIERGMAPGAKNMMGGRIYTHSLEKLVPDFRDRAPLERKVTKERISIGAGNEMTTIEYSYQDVKENEELQAYIDSYYRKKMTEAIYRQQLMTMNGKNGAVCAFIYHLIPLFGRQVKKGIFIDLQITNDDIANFCGVSTRNSVNRILRGLREENVITMVYHKILILDVDYLKRYVQ